MPDVPIEKILADHPFPEQDPNAKSHGHGRTDRWFWGRSARAMRLRSRRVKPMVKKILDNCPWIEQSDISTVRGFVDLELLGAALMADFLENGALKEGLPRPVIDKIIAIRRAQLTFASALGLTPAARQSIRASGTSAAVDLALAAHRRGEVEGTDSPAADGETADEPPVEVEATNGTLPSDNPT
jgi:hypothetical protein